MQPVMEWLLQTDDPAIRYRVQVDILKKVSSPRGTARLRAAVRSSPIAKALLAARSSDGRLPYHPYQKWCGAHWALAILAEWGYPSGQKELLPLREQVYQWLFSEHHLARSKPVAGRVRMCASQEGNALYYLLALGIADERADLLAERLVAWQWPDGGWNCDKRPQANCSSFLETLLPLRGLAWHARLTKSLTSLDATKKAAEFFLSRRLYRSARSGQIISPEFVRLHYPCYFHYDILFALKVMMEAGHLHDQRCQDALDLLQSKQLSDGGFPAEAKFYRVQSPAKIRSRCSSVDWGGVSRKKANPYVTIEALAILSAAGRTRFA